jgi:H+/gluconate symporter-like permease
MADHLLIVEVWRGYRPYVLVFIIDLLVAASLWGLLAGFKWITSLVPVREKAGEVIGYVHSVGVVIVFGVLAAGLVYDVVQIRRGKQP